MNYFETIILQSLFCLGFRTLMCDGMIFHFLRKPFEYDNGYKIINILRKNCCYTQDDKAKRIFFSKIIVNLLKPFILCVVCFSSVWGSIVFISLNGFMFKELIICCISTAFILKFINDKVDF